MKLLMTMALFFGLIVSGLSQDTLEAEGVPETIENLGTTERDVDAFVRGDDAFEPVEQEEPGNNTDVQDEEETPVKREDEKEFDDLEE
ncbi:hypothetical protein RCC89_14760 [Cytophagaceae bacterium ABcell3]|nr:hypothetical protein RCC89_14760 [Cytophagaceae bacterium ABcell3]